MGSRLREKEELLLLPAALRGDPIEHDQAWDDEREDAVESVAHRVRVPVHGDEHLHAEDDGE